MTSATMDRPSPSARKRIGDPRAGKVAAVAEIRKRLDASSLVVLADMDSVVTSENLELRDLLRKEGVKFKVYKNNLLGRALRDAGITVSEALLKGSTAVAFADDEVSAAKILWSFSKKTEKDKGTPRPRVKGGFVREKQKNNAWRDLPSAEIEALANLPSRAEVFAKLLGLLNAPARAVLGILQAPGATSVRLISMIGAAEAAPRHVENH